MNKNHDETAATTVVIEIAETKEVMIKEKTMNTLYASLHKIDRTLSAPIHREVNTQDAEKYVEQLIDETINNPNKRAFAFKDSTSPLSNYIIDIFNQREEEFIENLFNINSSNIAVRLLAAEKKSVEKYPVMNPPKKGSLIITANGDDKEFLVTIAKIETADFLDDVNLQLQSGLPFNKKALKTAIINITKLEDNQLEVQVTVTDSGSGISKYWTDDFLEVMELTSDVKNTKSAFNSIEKVLSQNLKTQAPSDYTELRNNLVGYFKTQPAFLFEKMIDQVFGEYTMDNPEVSLEDIKEKVSKLKEKEKFDTHFTIIANEIKGRFKKTYKVSEEIEIRTSGHIEGLRHIIKATKNSLGEKVLEIRVEDDKLYKEFEFKKDDITQ